MNAANGYLVASEQNIHSMPRYRILDQKGINYLTLTVVGWIDVFTRQAYRDILIESLDFCRREKGLMIFAYVIMSNHVHLIAQVREDARQDLSGILGDFKKYTSKKIIKSIETGPESRREWLMHMFRYYAKYNTNNREYQFWIQDNHPVLLYSPPVIWQKVQYVHRNPVRANIVDNPLAYLYSSARNYMYENKNCLLEIDLLEPWLPGSYYVSVEFR